MSEERDVAEARAEADEAQARIVATLHELQQRLAPRTLARDAWDGAKSKGADLAEDAVDAVKRRPVAAGGIVAALALFLAREPLIDLAGKLAGGKKRSKKKPGKTQDKDKVESEQ